MTQTVRGRLSSPRTLLTSASAHEVGKLNLEEAKH